MRYWIVKFAPFRVSWEHILATGKFEIYSIRGIQAQNNLKAMSIGDLVLFYHSQKELCVMGIMTVVREAHQDFTTKDDRWKSVTFQPVESFKNPISLSKIKSVVSLKNTTLVRQPRWSVGEISENEFNIIKSLSSIN